MITAAILAGGLGTRLRTVINDRPKALVPVGGRYFLAYLLDQLVDAGVRDVILCTGHMGERVREAFGERYRRLHLRYAHEDQPLGTAGALRHALPLIELETVLVLNGDSYCEVDLQAFLDFHREKHAEASIVLSEVAEAGRFGSVQCGSSGRVIGFVEKSHGGPGWISAGIYLVATRLLADLPAAVPISIERECFPSWLKRDFYSYRGGSRFIDIGTPASFAEAQSFFAAKMALGRSGRRRYVILDRDGTVTIERNYLSDPSQLELLPGAAAGIAKLRRLGFGLVMLTNQSGVGRGFFTDGQVGRVHDRLRAMLGEADLALDGIYLCPHTPEDNCECRKPKTAMVQQAARDLGFVPHECFVIGDKACDIDMGGAIGATTLLVRTGYGDEMARAGVQADFVAADVAEAAGIIAGQLSGSRTTSTRSSIAVNR